MNVVMRMIMIIMAVSMSMIMSMFMVMLVTVSMTMTVTAVTVPMSMTVIKNFHLYNVEYESKYCNHKHDATHDWLRSNDSECCLVYKPNCQSPDEDNTN